MSRSMLRKHLQAWLPLRILLSRLVDLSTHGWMNFSL
jgi:hypothetical protein